MGVGPDYDRRMREMLDKHEIREVLHRYARGVDRLDVNLINSVYHPDATDGHGLTPGKNAGEVFVAHMQHCDRSMHFISNETIELDGDVAHCETYFHAHDYNDDTDGSTVLHAYGRYVDRFERRNGEWRIASRVVVRESTHTERYVEKHPPKLRSYRSREDPSYHAAQRVGA